MAKEIEAIERVTSPGDLPSRLEAAENNTVDVEKRLAKTVSRLWDLRFLSQIYFCLVLISFARFPERLATGTGGRMGAMREEAKGRRTLARSHGSDVRGATEREETAQRPTGSEGKTHQRHIYTKD